MPILLNSAPVITNDAVVFSILLFILAFVANTSNSRHSFFKKLYAILPPIVLCYFLPGILNTANIIKGEGSGVYKVASQYLLPASLVLLIMGVDLKELWKLRKKAGVMFLTGAFGIVIGGPLAIIIVSFFAPSVVQNGMSDEASWRGLATVAGSWTGGSANMAALFEVFKPSTRLYSGMIALDVIMSNLWLALLMYGVSKKAAVNKFLNAEDGDLDEIREKFESNKDIVKRAPTMADIVSILAVGFGVSGLAHFLIGYIVPWIEINAPQLKQLNLTSEFFWLIVLTTTAGLLLSLTKIKKLEGAGASTFGNVCLYILITSIGMQMNIFNVFSNSGLLIVGLVWLVIHILLMIIMAKIFRINYFFLAVGSEANIGGAATSSIIAAAFHPSLIPVAVLLSVFGSAIGNYAGYFCGILMQLVSN